MADSDDDEKGGDALIWDEFSEVDFPVLQRIVKESVYRRHKGTEGHFSKFVRATQPDGVKHLKDPKRHSWECLSAFVGTLKEHEHMKMIRRHQRWEKSQRAQTAQPLDGRTPTSGGVWDLVRETQDHPLYDRYYGKLPSYLRGWLRTPRPGARTTPPHLPRGVPARRGVQGRRCARVRARRSKTAGAAPGRSHIIDRGPQAAHRRSGLRDGADDRRRQCTHVYQRNRLGWRADHRRAGAPCLTSVPQTCLYHVSFWLSVMTSVSGTGSTTTCASAALG